MQNFALFAVYFISVNYIMLGLFFMWLSISSLYIIKFYKNKQVHHKKHVVISNPL